MNKTERHQAAAARIDEISSKLHEFSAQCEAETKGMTTEQANKVWRDKYQASYNIWVRRLEAAGNMYFYTDDDVPLITKQANHRRAILAMRTAGSHRMNTVTR